MQLSTIIGKPILTRTGTRLGYVTGAYLTRDLKKIAALAAADGDEEEFFLPARAILSLSDAVIATTARADAPQGFPSPIGLPAFSPSGECLGVVCDWLFEDTAVLILSQNGVRTAVPVTNVRLGESVIVYPDGKRPAPRKKKPSAVKLPPEEPAPAEKEPLPTKNEPLSIEKEPIPTENEPISIEKEAAERPKEPVRFDLGGRNLLGRRVVRSVYDIDGRLVAAAGERITPDVLSRARRQGKLLALTVNTLTNL